MRPRPGWNSGAVLRRLECDPFRCLRSPAVGLDDALAGPEIRLNRRPPNSAHRIIAIAQARQPLMLPGTARVYPEDLANLERMERRRLVIEIESSAASNPGSRLRRSSDSSADSGFATRTGSSPSSPAKRSLSTGAIKAIVLISASPQPVMTSRVRRAEFASGIARRHDRRTQRHCRRNLTQPSDSRDLLGQISGFIQVRPERRRYHLESLPPLLLRPSRRSLSAG